MLEMWKVLDPYCKCAGYYTDEEERFDYERLSKNLKIINGAVPITAIVDGKEMTLLKMEFVYADGTGGVQYWTKEEVKWCREFCASYMKAHENKTRVEVTAREVKTPEEWEEAKAKTALLEKAALVEHSQTVKFPGLARRKRAVMDESPASG